MPNTRYYVADCVNILVTDQMLNNHWLQHYKTSRDGTPDIIIRFDNKLPGNHPVRFIELGKEGYTDMGYMMLTSDIPPGRMMIPLEQLGQSVTLVYERTANSLPYLEPIIHFEALIKGVLPLHAAAFHFHNKVWLAAGFPHGGKTSILLSFINEGADFISDDWTYIDSKGQVKGIRLPVTIRSWQLNQLPRLRQLVGSHNKRKLTVLKTTQYVAQFVSRIPLMPRTGKRLLKKVSNRLRDAMDLSIESEELFKHADLTSADTISIVLLPISHDSDDITIEPVSEEIGMAQLQQMQIHEWQPLLNAYAAYHSAMPDKYNHHIETLAEQLKTLLRQRLGGVPFYRVYHPHPVQLNMLFQSIHKNIED